MTPDPTHTSTVFLFGDDIDTDQIIPAQYLVTGDRNELATHCLEGADPGFASAVQQGDVIVAGKNFGCGSSREHASLAILGCGVQAVIATSFARIFFRNAVNLGLPLLEIPGAADSIAAGARIEVDVARGSARNLDTGEEFEAPPESPFTLEVRRAGGLMNWVAERAGLPGAQDRVGADS